MGITGFLREDSHPKFHATEKKVKKRWSGGRSVGSRRFGKTRRGFRKSTRERPMRVAKRENSRSCGSTISFALNAARTGGDQLADIIWISAALRDWRLPGRGGGKNLHLKDEIQVESGISKDGYFPQGRNLKKEKNFL